MGKADGQITLGLKIKETTALLKQQLQGIADKLNIKFTGRLDKSKTKKQLTSDINGIEPAKIKISAKLNKTAAKKQLKSDLQSLDDTAKITVDADIDMDTLKKRLKSTNIKTAIDVDGAETLNGVGDSLDSINGKSARTVASISLLSRAFSGMEQAARQMVQTAAELDASLTDLRMVTGASYDEAAAYIKEYNALAQEIGATTKEVTDAASEWLRQGKSIAETEELINQSMILSKVGAMESATATERLTSTMNGYGLRVDEIAGVVDKLTSVDMAAAVSADELAEALSHTASSASLAGIDLDKILAYITVVSETTRKSSSVIGESFKSIFARMGKVTNGDAVDDYGENISNVEETLRSLGIEMRKSETEFRDFDDILDEIGSKWDSYSSVVQRQFSTIIGGTYQSENFLALMNNYEKVKEYVDVAANSAGTAAEKFNAYQESVDAHYNAMKAAAESLAMNTVSSDFMNTVLQATSALLKFIDNLHLLQIALAALGAVGVVKGFTIIGGKIKDIYTDVSKLSSAFNILSKAANGSLSADQFDSLLKCTNGLNESQLRLIVTQKALTNEQRMQLLMASGLTEQEAQQTLVTLGLATAEGTATTATFSLSGAFKALTAAIAANPIGFIVVALTTVISIISAVSDSIQQAKEETRQAALEAAEATKEEISALQELLSAYEDASTAYENNTGTKEDLEAATDALLEKLGVEKSEISELAAEYGNLDKAIHGITADALKQDWSNLLSGLSASEDNLLEHIKNSWFSSYNTISGSGAKTAEILNRAGLISDGSYNENFAVYLGDNKSVEGALEMYDKLLEMDKVLTDAVANGELSSDFLKNDDFYNLIKGKINDMKEYVEAYKGYVADMNRVAAQIQVEEYLSTNDAPATVDDYLSLRKEMIEKASGNELFYGDYQDQVDAIDQYMQSAFDTIYDHYAVNQAKIDEIASAMVPKNYEELEEGTAAHFHAIDEYGAKITKLKENLSTLSDSDLDIAYGILSVPESGIESWEQLMTAIDEYKNGTGEIISGSYTAKNALRELWDSEAFADTKTSILEMANTLDGITAKNVEDLAESSDGLASILEIDGMNAQFLAKVLQEIAEGNDGFALITEGALALNAALDGMVDSFDGVVDAKSRYDAAMSVEEKDTDFKSYAAAFEELNKQFEAGTTNSNAFWAAAEFLFGKDQLALWGWSDGLDEIYSAMEKNKSVFEDADSAGAGFIDRLYRMSEAGRLVNEEGEQLLEISKDADGAYAFDIDPDNLDEIAEKMGLTKEAVLACLKALSMWGDIDFYDMTEVMDTIENIGLAAENAGTKAVNLSLLVDQLVSLGKTDKEIYDIVQHLQELDNVELIDGESSVESLTQSLLNLGLALQDGGELSINTDGLADLLSQMSFTKEEAQNLITKLDEADGITLTNAKGEVQSLKDAFDYIDTIDFATAETNVDNLASSISDLDDTKTNSVTAEIDQITNSVDIAQQSVEDLQRSIRNLSGKTVVVTVDVQRKGDLLGMLGFAKGTDNAPETDALVGEKGAELVKSGDYAYLAGANGAEIVHLKKGDQVFTADETKKMLNATGKSITGRIPAYETGRAATRGLYVQNSKTGTTGTEINGSVNANVTVSVDNKALEESLKDTLDEMKKNFDDIIGNFEHQIFLMEKNGASDAEIVQVYKKMQEEVHRQAEEYRKLGLDENSDYIQNLQKQWWEFADSIKDQIINYYDTLVKTNENSITLMQNWLDNAVAGNDYESVRRYTSEIVDCYKQMQEAIHEQAEFYRSMGYSDTSDEVSKLSDLWWDYQQNILNTTTDTFAKLVENASDAVDEIQNVYSTLKDAAKEYAENGFVTVDTLQDIASFGVQYLAFLEDENGALVINEQNIQKVIAARTQQLAVEQALSYIEQLRTALSSNDAIALQNLLTATDAATSSTWGLVYAQLAALNLDSNQYQAALQRINTLRSLTDLAVTSIGQTTGKITEGLQETSDALDDILDYVIDMIKQEVNNQIDALEDQIDRYKEIVDLKKESLRLAKEEDEYNKDVSDKLKDISKLQARIQQLSLDDSREAQAERAKLEEELAEKQADLADKQSDYAYDATVDSLDKQADAFEKEKQQEIAILQDSISSYEKLYQMAINRINNHWDTLYNDLINWNTQYGSDTNEKLTAAWNNASAAVQQYGSYLAAVAATQSALNAASSSIGGGSTIGSIGDYSSDEAYGQQVGSIVKQMKANSAAWHNADAAKRKQLDQANAALAAQLSQILGRTVVRDDKAGVWYLDRIGGTKLYDMYHKGGIVGEPAKLKDNETIAVLEKGEMVLDEQKKQGLYRIVDAKETFGKAFEVCNLLNSQALGNHISQNQQDNIRRENAQAMDRISDKAMVISPQIDASVTIQGNVDKSAWDRVYSDMKRHSSEVAQIVNAETMRTFNIRGIKK